LFYLTLCVTYAGEKALLNQEAIKQYCSVLISERVDAMLAVVSLKRNYTSVTICAAFLEVHFV